MDIKDDAVTSCLKETGGGAAERSEEGMTHTNILNKKKFFSINLKCKGTQNSCILKFKYNQLFPNLWP